VRQTTVWLLTTGIFSVFSGYLFGNFSDKRSVIIQNNYAAPRRLTMWSQNA